MSETKRLYRSRDDKMLAGICGGLAQYFNIDPVIVRLVALVLLFAGPGLFVYLVMWIITPEQPVV